MRAHNVAARVLGGGALALVAIVAGVLLLAGGSSYRVRLLFSDASGLVVGDQVMIGPSNVGSVSEIALTGHGQAAVTIGLQADAAPLHRGTVARIANSGLAAIASHYITLQPAAVSAPAIPSGATIPESQTHPEVALDQIFNTLDPLTRRGLRNVVRGEAQSIAGRSSAANAALLYLAPVLQSTASVTAALRRYEPSFDRLLVDGAQTMALLASRSQQLTDLVARARQVTGALASQGSALSQTLGLLPAALSRSTATFAGLRRTLAALTPLVDAAKPAVTQLPQFALALEHFATAAAPTLRSLVALIRSGSAANLTVALRQAPALERLAVSAFPAIIGAIAAQQSSGQLDALRQYTPDIIAALTNLGQASGYYDANGHYVRTAPFYGAYGVNAGQLTDTLPADRQNGGTPDRYGGLTLVSGGRCPGSATQPAADGSMPAPNSGCAASNTPPGP